MPAHTETTTIPDTGRPWPGTASSVSDVIADVVAELAPATFGVMGNGNAFFVSRLTDIGHRYVKARHEAGALAMALGTASADGGVAVATTTYGPGFTNALTPLAEAAKGRIPCVLVTGQGPRTPRPFDVDQVALAELLGAHAMVVEPAAAQRQTYEAFDIARLESRPVVLSIPYDIAAAQAPDQEPYQQPVPSPEVPGPSTADVMGISELLSSARRPLVVVGRGGIESAAAPSARSIGDKIGALFATSVFARGAFGSEWDLGVAGGFNTVEAADVMRAADVVLVLGASLNYFQTRYETLFTGAREVIQIDTDAQATSPVVTRHVQADAGRYAELLDAALVHRPEGRWRDVLPEVVDRSLHRLDTLPEFAPDGLLDPRAVTVAMDRILPQQRTIVQDGGHNIVWMNALARVPDPAGMHNSGLAFQSIGMGFPYAVGAAVARPDHLLVAVCGDGGGMMTLPELETLIREVPRCVVLAYNDSAYAMEIHQYVPRGLDDEGMVFPDVDLAGVARALGARSIRAHSLAELDELEQWLDSGEPGTFFVEAMVSPAVVGEYVTEKLAIELAQEG